MGPLGLTTPSDERIAINSTDALIYVDLGEISNVIQIYLEQKLTSEVLLHHPSKSQR